MAAQWGLVTTAQARRMGVARSLMSKLESAGKLERLCQGVYRSASNPSERFEALHAAWLSLYPKRTAEERLRGFPPDAVVSSHTAAWVLGVGDFVPEPYCFSVPVRRQTQRTDIALHLKSYAPTSLTVREGLPVTTFEQTVADLIADDTDLSLVSDVFLNCGFAVYDGLDRPYLEKLLASYAKRNGFAAGDGKGLLCTLTAPVDRNIQRAIEAAREMSSQMTAPQLDALQDRLISAQIPQHVLDSLRPVIDGIAEAQDEVSRRAAREILEAARPGLAQGLRIPDYRQVTGTVDMTQSSEGVER